MTATRHIDVSTLNDYIEQMKRGLRTIGANDETPPEEIIAIISMHIDRIKADTSPHSPDDIFALGVLLGWQYVRGHDWHWREVVWQADAIEIGVLPRDDSLFINPMWWIEKTLDDDQPCNFLDNYQLMASLCGNNASYANPTNIN